MLTIRELRHLTKSAYVFFVKTAPRTIYYSRSNYHPMQRGSDDHGCAYGRAVKVIGGFAAIVDGLMECYEDGKPHCDKCKERNNEQ